MLRLVKLLTLIIFYILYQLVSVNNPDKIIFVGEALVGNEAVDQLTKFNQALKDFSGLQNPRHIDGIILTKFDTIDDKVCTKINDPNHSSKQEKILISFFTL